MDLKEINRLLIQKGPQVIAHLFPGVGKISGERFTAGDINGNAGDSFVVYLKDGRFKDFATDDHGDMLELFVLKHGSKKAGIDAAHDFLGIEKKTKAEDKVIAWSRPKKDWSQLTEHPAVLSYLTEKRRIPLHVLDEAKVRGKDDSEYVFPLQTHDKDPVCCGAMFVKLKRKKNKAGELKKQTYQSTNLLHTLFAATTCPLNIKNAKGKKFLIITEGQLDCLSYRAQGIKNVVSIPCGAEDFKWVQASWDFLQEFDEIYLSYDNDAVGQKNMEKAVKLLGFEKCRRCVIPAHFNDANAAHVESYDLHKAVDAAIEFKPERLISTGEIIGETLSRMSKGRREDQGIPFLGWVDEEDTIRFRIRPKEMTIYTGFPGSGKSNILYQAAAHLIFKENQKVVMASLEEDTEDILGLILIHALSIQYSQEKNIHKAFLAAGNYLDQRLFFYHHRNRAPFEELLKTAEFTIRKHGAQHFIMDSVAKTDLDIEDNKESNQFVNLVTTSMNDTGAHYHLVAHSRKGDDRDFNSIPGLQEIKGAAAFGIETFNSMTIWRNHAKAVMLKKAQKSSGGFMSKKGGQFSESDVRKMGDSIMWLSKQKVGGHTGRFDLFFNPYNYRISRRYDAIEEPYATDIYEEFIKGKATENKAEEEADF